MSDDHIMNKPGGEELSADENVNGGDGSGAGSAQGAADSGTDAGLMPMLRRMLPKSRKRR